MHKIFIFYFLLFLIFLPLILSTNLVNKINEFSEKFNVKFEKLQKKMSKISDKEKESLMNDKKFSDAMFKKEFPSEIVKASVEMGKYSERKINFEVILKVMNSLKLEGDKLEELKELQNQLKKKNIIGKIRSYVFSQVNSLVNYLVEMRESVNESVVEIVEELRFGRIKVLLSNLDHWIKEQKNEFDRPFEMFLKKYRPEFFTMIKDYIKSAKAKLQSKLAFNIWKWPNSHLPLQVIEDRDMLRRAIFNSKLLMQKVKLNKPTKWDIPIPAEEHLDKICVLLDEYVDGLPKMLSDTNDRLRFGGRIQKEFDSLRAKWDYPKSLNIACDKMWGRIKPLVNKDANDIEQRSYLTDMHFLTEFIEGKFVKMNISTKTMESEELPKKLEINGKMKPKKKAIVIAKNMLFIVAQLRKCHNFEKVIDEISASSFDERTGNARIYQLVLKELPPKNFGQFVYEKYAEMSEREISAKNERSSDFESSSSSNVRVNEGKDDDQWKALFE